MTNKFATAILKAAEIREDSYNHQASNEAVEKGRSIDFGKLYQKTMFGAAREAVKEVGLDTAMTQPVYLLLELAWNQALDWANGENETKGGENQ